MPLKPLLAVLATSALATQLIHRLSRQRRLRHDGRQQRDEVSRWEAEGGNLPATPPAVKAQRSSR